MKSIRHSYIVLVISIWALILFETSSLAQLRGQKASHPTYPSYGSNDNDKAQNYPSQQQQQRPKSGTEKESGYPYSSYENPKSPLYDGQNTKPYEWSQEEKDDLILPPPPTDASPQARIIRLSTVIARFLNAVRAKGWVKVLHPLWNKAIDFFVLFIMSFFDESIKFPGDSFFGSFHDLSKNHKKEL
jgi:hypothetical protein